MAFWTKIFKKQKAADVASRAPQKKEEIPQRAESISRLPQGEGARVMSRGILRGPHITEKTSNAAKASTYVFSIAPEANKTQVARAVEDRYKVNVSRVRVINLPAKKRMRGRQIGWKPGLRKAMVALQDGQTIEIQ